MANMPQGAWFPSNPAGDAVSQPGAPSRGVDMVDRPAMAAWSQRPPQEPIGSMDDDYRKALVNHQCCRKDRIKRELESSQHELKQLQEEIEHKKLSHSVFVEANTSYPSEEDVQLLEGSTSSLKADIEGMKQRLEKYRKITNPGIHSGTSPPLDDGGEQHWTCKYCTWLNHPAMTTTCEVCEMPKWVA